MPAPARSVRLRLLAPLLLGFPLWMCGAHAQPVAPGLVEAARTAAREDRNREAADLFARAIAADPSLRTALLREYADQLLYSGRARDAIPLFRERLDAGPDPDERLRLLKGLALALLWSDRPGEAARVYEEVLAVAPGDGDARRNQARALAWSARPRAATAALEAWLAGEPGDAEARRLLAETRGWMGRPDLAAVEGRRAGDDPASLRLRRQLEQGAAPVTRLELSRSSQSDRLDIEAWGLVHEQPLLGGRSLVGARFDRLRFEPEAGGRRVVIDRPLLVARHRFSDALELNTRVGVEQVDLDTGRDYSRSVHATWLTWWPSDLLRFDLSAGRSTFDSLRALDLGLSARTVGLSVDVVPNERRRASVRLERADISDGNRRDRVQVLAEQRLHLRLGAWAGLRWTAFEFERQLDNGYFNPRRLHSPQATFRMAPRADEDRRWNVALESAWGREYVEPGRSQPAWELGVTGGVRLAEAWRLDAGWRRFSTRTSALSGFERTIANLTLQARW